MPDDKFLNKTDREIAIEKKARRMLGIGPNAGTAEIKKAFWAWAMENHPDKHPGDKEAEKRFIAFQAAYEFLIKGVPVDSLPPMEDSPDPAELEENPWKYFAWWHKQFE